jgi:hypothetical protein
MPYIRRSLVLHGRYVFLLPSRAALEVYLLTTLSQKYVTRRSLALFFLSLWDFVGTGFALLHFDCWFSALSVLRQVIVHTLSPLWNNLGIWLIYLLMSKSACSWDC